MVFLWFSYGFPMVFLWFSYGFPMVFLWFSYGFPGDIPMFRATALSLPRAPRSDAKRPAGCWPWRWSSRTPKTVGYIELTCIDIYIYMYIYVQSYRYRYRY